MTTPAAPDLVNVHYIKAKRYPGVVWILMANRNRWVAKDTYKTAAKTARWNGLDHVWLEVGRHRIRVSATDDHPHTITVAIPTQPQQEAKDLT